MSGADSQIPACSTVDERAKAIANLRARFALAGHEMHVIKLQDSREYFEVRRWGQACMFSNIHGVTAFLSQIGAGS